MTNIRPMAPNQIRFHNMLAMFLLIQIVGFVQCWPTDAKSHGVLLLKKSDAPQWEDLGWAWGKRAAPAPAASPQWDDLGWSWGKKKRAASAAAPQWDDLGWSWGKRAADSTGFGREADAEQLIEQSAQQMEQRPTRAVKPLSSLSNSRVMRSAAAKPNPDWHDLGWAWGRRK